MNIDPKERLLEAGVKLMLEGGFNSTGIKDVVQLAGVPKGSFYYYFGSKDDYAAEVVDRYADAGLADRALILQDETVAPLARLRRSFETYQRRYEDRQFAEGCLLGNLSIDIGARNVVVRDRLRAAFKVWEGDIVAMLEAARETGALPPSLEPARTAAFLLNAWEGALVRMKAEQDGQPLRDFLDVFDLILSPAP